MNFLLNGKASGDVASVLMANNFDPGALRPFIGKNGQSYMTLNDTGGPKTIVANATATLRKDEWIQLDQAVIKAAKPRLNAVADLRSAGLQYTIPNGMARTVLQHEAQSDIGPAITSMDGLREGDTERPVYDLRNLPLPIIHKDFSFSARQVMASRNGGSPLDTTMAELAGRQVAEEAERLLLGESSSYSYGGGSVFGYKNFPQRLTKTLSTPTSSTHGVVVQEVLDMIKQATDNNYFGPYILYYSPDWYSFMDQDYTSSVNQTWTLKDRLERITALSSVKNADFMTGTTLMLVQQTSDVARMVIGMDMTTVQWESHGGMMLNYKVMTIMVPQLRSDFKSQTGIVHGSV